MRIIMYTLIYIFAKHVTVTSQGMCKASACFTVSIILWWICSIQFVYVRMPLACWLNRTGNNHKFLYRISSRSVNLVIATYTGSGTRRLLALKVRSANQQLNYIALNTQTTLNTSKYSESLFRTHITSCCTCAHIHIFCNLVKNNLSLLRI